MSSSQNQSIPPASFGFLISTLAAQAMTTLGKAPDPITNQTQVNAELAKHFIDTLGILEEKTRGNLTPDEHGLLEAVLHELRLAYLSVKP